MSRDPLPALLRVRQIALDESRQSLASSLRAEAEAEAGIRSAEHAIEVESDAARDLSAGDGAVEAFAAWLPGARRRADAAEAALATAQAETARSRAGLTLARAAVEAVLALQERQAAERAAAEARKEQHSLDDIAQRRPDR